MNIRHDPIRVPVAVVALSIALCSCRPEPNAGALPGQSEAPMAVVQRKIDEAGAAVKAAENAMAEAERTDDEAAVARAYGAVANADEAIRTAQREFDRMNSAREERGSPPRHDGRESK
jgi:hypothetical protein